MNNEFLLDMMSEIDFELLERADEPVPIYQKPRFRIALVAAALFALLVFVPVGIGTYATVDYVNYVKDTFPEYDGTVLHLAEILLTEDENFVSRLLDDDSKRALGSMIAALRQGGSGEQTEPEPDTEDREAQTEEPEQDTSDMGGEVTDTEQTTDAPEETTKETEESTSHVGYPAPIIVHISRDGLDLVGEDTRSVIYVLETYGNWKKRVEITESDYSHLEYRGWISFSDVTPGTYGYKIDNGESVYDTAFSQEPESTVYAVSAYMGGKSCSRMEILIPVADLTPGEHTVKTYVKATDGRISVLEVFTVVIPDTNDSSDLDQEFPDEPPAQGWSEGLAYTSEEQDGQTVYVVAGIGECSDTAIYVPPMYRGCRVAAIGIRAFENQGGIVSVTLPSTVREIRDSAFRYCTKLSKVSLPTGLEVIGSNAFEGTVNLMQIQFPNTLKTIRGAAFSSSGLEQIVLPDSVQAIETHAFSYCQNMESVVLSESLTYIPGNAFKGNVLLKSVMIPQGVSLIVDYAFESCYALEYVKLPAGLIDVGQGAFMNCGITAQEFVVDCAETETRYYSMAFAGSGLKSFEIADRKLSVPQGMFQGCQVLETVTLPESIVEIGEGAFDNCPSLKEVRFKGTQSDWEAIEMSAQARQQLTPLVVCLG